MKSNRKTKKQVRKLNEIIISDDIDTTESYVGVGQQNIVSNAYNYEINDDGLGCLPSDLQANVVDKTKIYEHNFLANFTVSPELEFNFPSQDNSRKFSKRSTGREKNIKSSAIKSGGIKTSNGVTSLPILNVKKPVAERDSNDLKSPTINDQIEKIEHRKQSITLSERKSRMKEIVLKGRQNWSNFKTDIDFIKLVESNNFIPSNETASIIKDEKLLNTILNELSSEDSTNASNDIHTPVNITTHIPISDHKSSLEIDPIYGVDNQENLLEFNCKIIPMQKSHISKCLMEDVAMSIKNIVFNSTCRSWGAEWYRQNIDFCPIDSECPFAMIQRMEGPNSVMSVVQAEFLVEALFHSDISLNWVYNVKRNRNQLLANALSRIMSRCRRSKAATHQICLLDVKLKGRNMGSMKPDGITECIVVYNLSTKEELQEFILHHISQFIDVGSPGLILLVVSCLLTYDISQCMFDLKFNGIRLISPLGFPREELFNLLLSGKITSHYFNDTIQVINESGSYASLSGVPSRCTVGFLTTDIHCQYCKDIGTYFKTPKYPVWIAKLEDNNYIIMYCLNGNLVNDWKTEIKFQLNIYSPLFAKKGILKITIDSSACQTEKSRMLEEMKMIEAEKDRRNKELTNKRLQNMSDSSLKFLLDDESIDDYLNGSFTIGQTMNEMNLIEKIIFIKWPKAHILLNDDQSDIFSLFKH